MNVIKSHIKATSAYALLLILVAGCSSLPVMREPATIPYIVATYRAGELTGVAEAMAVAIDVSDTVEYALLVEKGGFGGTDVAASYPVRKVIEREFKRVVGDNFHEARVGEKPDVFLRLTTSRVLLTKKSGDVTSDVSIVVRLCHPDPLRPPVFKKTYRKSAKCKARDDNWILPECFYEAVQRIAEDFSMDISSDWKLVAYFEGKAQKKGDK